MILPPRLCKTISILHSALRESWGRARREARDRKAIQKTLCRVCPRHSMT